MKILLKIAGSLLICIFLIGLLGYLWLWMSLNGGIQGTISSLKTAPNPSSETMIKKRTEVINAINGSFNDIERMMGFQSYATSTHDRCYKGQNSWKRVDGYAYRCTYRITKFYGFNTDFREQMIQFEEQLFRLDWKTFFTEPAYPMRAILEEYYDEYYGTLKGKRDYPRGYFVSNLPTPSNDYYKKGEMLELEYAERAKKELFSLEYAQQVNGDTLHEIYDVKNFQDISAVFDQITGQNNYVLEVSIQKNYFQN
jgi:hypothetical protein